MSNSGWIKLNRNIMEWQWFTSPQTLQLYIYCRLKANYQDVSFQGIKLKKGQFITSLESLSSSTGLSIHRVRNSLKHLVDAGEIEMKTTNKYRLITICGSIDCDDVSELTPQAKPKQRATDNNTRHKDVKEKKEKKEKITHKGAENFVEGKKDLGVGVGDEDAAGASKKLASGSGDAGGSGDVGGSGGSASGGSGGDGGFGDSGSGKGAKNLGSGGGSGGVAHSSNAEIRERIAAFDNWIKSCVPTLLDMKEPLSYRQKEAMLLSYSSEDIMRILQAIHNKGSMRYRNAYDTFCLFVRNDFELNGRSASGGSGGVSGIGSRGSRGAKTSGRKKGEFARGKFTYEQVCDQVTLYGLDMAKDFKRLGNTGYWAKV